MGYFKLFLILLSLNYLFPLLGDDNIVLYVKNNMSFFEGIKWFYSGSNPRIQNILSLVFVTKSMVYHNIFSSFIGVLFVYLIQKIQEIQFNSIQILLIGIIPAIWTDLYLIAPSFYNHFLGLIIGLITYLGFKENWNILILSSLMIILGNTGILISIPFIILIGYTYQRFEILFGIFGFIIFYQFEGTHTRAEGLNKHIITDITYLWYKFLHSLKFFIIPAFITIINLNHIRLTKSTKGFILASIVAYTLTLIAPVGNISLDRWTGIIQILYLIGILPYIKSFNKYLVYGYIILWSISLGIFKSGNDNKTLLHRIFISQEIRHSSIDQWLKMIENGKK